MTRFLEEGAGRSRPARKRTRMRVREMDGVREDEREKKTEGVIEI